MIKGSYFNGETSDKKDVSLYYKDDGNVGFEELDIAEVPLHLINISSRIGNTPRYLSFPDGSQFETEDNAAIDKMVNTLSNDPLHGLAHKLESTKGFILFTLVAVVLFGWLFIQYGIPAMSKQLAEMLPEEASQYMGQGVLDAMDKNLFEPSQLEQQRQDELRILFNDLLKNIEGSQSYKIEFRLGGKIKANAFALPNGTIVFTDELINLAENNLEIVSIMLHEIGHLKRKHSLRATIQQFSLAMFVMVVTGDVSTSSSIITAIPIMLVESGFSQGMETEADTYSLDYMRKHNIDPNYFAIMMEKLEASYSQEYVACMEAISKESNKQSKIIQCINDAVKLNKEENGKANKTAVDYFSTHPSSEERIGRFREKTSSSVKKK
ncbi:MAG: M48 family metallopeptidase [Gammaproteobacteria bacterium]|nr:M48 family metallopeptidase [Gammaproteobacteria bacterium]MCW8988721.1 M48 family metallopeptidase [Gammaproteobacteria bacterium]